ncbi:cyclic pyranopterin monophosphate synthase MoaC [Candidatus Bathyarchaeota archaeon]|nr:cyclic pyranopterin monophosphate synthase MoaC [Candidatus Bathyarchaeota archaeon]
MRQNRFRMVDISSKDDVYREATAVGRLRLRPETAKMIRDGKIEKGDPLSVAEVGAMLAAKNTSQLLPLCHPIPLTKIQTTASVGENYVEVEANVKSTGKTGVEMEALTAATIYLLNVWDMVKKLEKDQKGRYPETWIEYVKVKEKLKG